MNKLGIYIHIPYCRSKCPYCDFFSLADTGTAQRYTERVCEEIELFFSQNGCKADTLYIGGGTPSVLPGEQIAAIVRCAQKHCNNGINEITVECNPSDTAEVFLREIYAAGVNRLSFGMQSAVDSERRALGRRARCEQVAAAVKNAQIIGFGNISLDLMLGIPRQTRESLSESIRFCASLGVQHISAYLLKIEPETVFEKKKDMLALPDDDMSADLYLQAVDELERVGFKQYEISNFAKPGFESRHNLKYWRLENYVGIGAAAHCFVNGKRFFFPRDIDYFISGGAPTEDGDGGDRNEQIMLGLRLKEGIDTSLLSNAARKSLRELQQQGYLTLTGTTAALTPAGCLISNAIIHMLTED